SNDLRCPPVQRFAFCVVKRTPQSDWMNSDADSLVSLVARLRATRAAQPQEVWGVGPSPLVTSWPRLRATGATRRTRATGATRVHRTPRSSVRGVACGVTAC